MIDDQLDPVVPSGQRADRERRIAWRTASVIILLNSLLNGIAAVIALEAVQLAVLIPATVVDIFLAVNLWRDKKWARDWTIVRLILGMILWSLLNYASGGWIGVVTTVLLVVPLLLVLLGRPRTWRTVIGALWFLLVFLVLLNLMLLGLLRANLSDMPPITLSKMQEAEAALQEGDYVVAIRLYGEVTRSEPDNVNARYGLCRAYLTSENPSLAINSCDKAVEMAPKSAEIRAYQALVLLNMDRHDAALASTEVALTLDDTSYLAYLVRAIVRANRGDLAAARDDLGHAMEYAPDDDARAFVRDVAGQILSQEGARSSGGSSRHHVHASRSCSHASPKYAFRTRSSANNVAAGPESTMLPVSST